MTSSPQTPTYSRRSGLNAVSMNGELVMMGLEQGEYFGLREVAASIWEHLAEPRSLDELCTLVAEEYDITAEQCRSDVETFLDSLVVKKLVDAS